ncbi:MAG TPA: carbonic anhydrase, partial [Burkholderiaceae bacterium]|nr:carbonic anhydrase [Burkholderiaceae bacterium]
MTITRPATENQRRAGHRPQSRRLLGAEWLPPWDAHDAGGHGQRRPRCLRAVLKVHSDMTIYTPELVQRNATFAAGRAFKGLPFPANPALRVIGCVDSRVEPSDVLGLKLGEAVVMRNIGGRVTPEALRSWGTAGPPRLRPAAQRGTAGDPAPHRLRDPSPGQLPRAVGRFLRDP